VIYLFTKYNSKFHSTQLLSVANDLTATKMYNCLSSLSENFFDLFIYFFYLWMTKVTFKSQYNNILRLCLICGQEFKRKLKDEVLLV